MFKVSFSVDGYNMKQEYFKNNKNKGKWPW